jgi:hypothetical protein
MRACTKRNSTPKTRASHPKPRKNEAVADIHIKYFLDIIVIEAGRYSYERFLRYYWYLNGKRMIIIRKKEAGRCSLFLLLQKSVP